MDAPVLPEAVTQIDWIKYIPTVVQCHDIPLGQLRRGHCVVLKSGLWIVTRSQVRRLFPSSRTVAETGGWIVHLQALTGNEPNQRVSMAGPTVLVIDQGTESYRRVFATLPPAVVSAQAQHDEREAVRDSREAGRDAREAARDHRQEEREHRQEGTDDSSNRLNPP
jgi:hypothetical protein